MSWKLREEERDGGSVRWAEVLEGERILSWQEVITLWRSEAAFRGFFSKALAGAPFEGFFFETPPLTRESMGDPFEFVLVNGQVLTTLRADAGPFGNQFAIAGQAEEVLTFPNLGHDAILVVPSPQGEEERYAHLAAFLRGAPAGQIDVFWKSVGDAMEGHVSAQPTWLSTAGLGVSWLHLRLDSRPKYYRYRPYKGRR